MLNGRCPKCRVLFYGWALHLSRYQTCDKCGAGLEIADESGRVFEGYSPFTTGKYIINPLTPPLRKAKEKGGPIQEE